MAPIISAARQRLIQMGLSPSQIEALRDKPPGTITSDLWTPVDGTIVLKQVYEGQYVSEGDRLFEATDFSTMWVQLNAYESDQAWLRVGQPARITTPSWNGGVITGRVTFIDPNFDPMTRSSRVRVEVPNPVVETDQGPRRRLLHRVTALAEIESTAVGLSLPRSALLWNGRESLVYLSHDGGAFEARKVRIGRIGDHRAEVLEGLAAGDRVVTQAAFLLDAQSQLQSGHGGESTEAAPPVVSGPRTAVPAAVSEYLQLSAELAEALAADHLKAFQDALKSQQTRREALDRWLGGSGDTAPEALKKTLAATTNAPMNTPTTLADARKWFLEQSRASVELARWAHRQGWSPGVRIFECPMVDRAIPSAPKRAQWLQTRTAVRNPFFGAEMLDCGLELKEKP
jgi:Cu(I)/Ag(I) efflux system membrane fusion protein